MSRLAIVSAMGQEQRALLAQLPQATRQMVAGREVWLGQLFGHELALTVSRIGKVAAATTATALIERLEVRRILFTGVAGGLAEGVRVGDMVVAREFLQHDLDASPIFPRYEVPLYGCSRFASDAALSDSLSLAAQDALNDRDELLGRDALASFKLDTPRLHHGLIVSGDRFVSSAAESRTLREELPEALAVEMEGAAVAQVCHDYGVPFAALRTISDRADDKAHVDFLRFIEEVASLYSAAVVGKLLARLPS